MELDIKEINTIGLLKETERSSRYTLSPEEQSLQKTADVAGGESKLPRGQFIRLMTLRHMRLNGLSEKKATELASLERDADEAGDISKLSKDQHIRLNALTYMALTTISEEDAMELATLALEQTEAGGRLQGSEFISNLPPEKYARLKVLQSLLRSREK